MYSAQQTRALLLGYTQEQRLADLELLGQTRPPPVFVQPVTEYSL